MALGPDHPHRLRFRFAGLLLTAAMALASCGGSLKEQAVAELVTGDDPMPMLLASCVVDRVDRGLGLENIGSSVNDALYKEASLYVDECMADKTVRDAVLMALAE